SRHRPSEPAEPRAKSERLSRTYPWHKAAAQPFSFKKGFQMKFQPMIEVLEDRCVPAAQFTSVSSAVMKDGTLQVLFKESGINTTMARTEELTGTANVSYQWSTKGGKTPQGPVFASPTVQMDVKSQWISTTSGYFYVAPPPPTSNFLAYPHSSTWVAI